MISVNRLDDTFQKVCLNHFRKIAKRKKIFTEGNSKYVRIKVNSCANGDHAIFFSERNSAERA